MADGVDHGGDHKQRGRQVDRAQLAVDHQLFRREQLKVQVRHRPDDEIVGRSGHVLQGIGRQMGQLAQRDALHGLFHQGLALVVGAQIIDQLLLPAPGDHIALGQPLDQKGLGQFGVQTQHLGHQVFQIDDLNAVVAQDPGKGVVLLLRDFQIRNVVEQQLGEAIGGEVQQLAARTVQQHLFERADLACHANAFHSFSFSNGPLVAFRRRHRRRQTAEISAIKHTISARKVQARESIFADPSLLLHISSGCSQLKNF